MSQASDEYVEMCERAARNVERAVIDDGPYRLAPEFQDLRKTKEEWLKMSEKEKRDHLKRISPLAQTAVAEKTELPTDEETNVLGNFADSVLPGMFEASWQNAEMILKDDGVGQAPGSQRNKVVTLQVILFILSRSMMENYHIATAKASSTKPSAHMSWQYLFRWAPWNKLLQIGNQTSLANLKKACQREQAVKKTRKAGKESGKRTQRNDPLQVSRKEFH